MVVGQKDSKKISCLGSDEVKDSKDEIIVIPSKPNVEIPVSLHFKNIMVSIQNRTIFESTLLSFVKNDLLQQMKKSNVSKTNIANSSDCKIVSRLLKFGTDF